VANFTSALNRPHIWIHGSFYS